MWVFDYLIDCILDMLLANEASKNQMCSYAD